MRTLHTLKGGARLAGAMRLGEMAHRLETRDRAPAARSEPTPRPPTSRRCRRASDALTQRLRGAAPARRRRPMPTRSPRRRAERRCRAAPRPMPSAAPLVGAAGRADADAVAPPRRRAAPTPPSADAAPRPTAPAARPRRAPLPRRAARRPRRAAPSCRRSTGRASPADARRAAPGRPSGAGAGQSAVRVRAPLLDRLVNQAGEVSITRSRIEAERRPDQGSLARPDRQPGAPAPASCATSSCRPRRRCSSRLEAAKAASQAFDPLEFDRFTRFQELTRMMAESVNDVATVQRTPAAHAASRPRTSWSRRRA